MKYLSVCSGIETATLAWKPLGWQAVAFAEIEKFPCAVLAYHYPDVPNLGDMTKIDGEKYSGAVDIVVGGTPCQDFSLAGKRAGMAGERGKLALAFVDLVHKVLPRWLVWENVPGVLSSGGGNDFADFLLALRKCGYHVGYRVLDAQYFGVPQKRRRVFLVGYFGDWRPAATVLFEPESLCRGTPPSRQKGAEVAGTLKGSAGGRGANSAGVDINGFLHVTQVLTGRLGGGGPDDNKAQGGFYVPEIVCQAVSCKWSKGTSGPAGDEHHNLVMQAKFAVRRLTPKECERLQGFPDNYTAVPGASDSARYRALGNSMAVPVMRWIGERIKHYEEPDSPSGAICKRIIQTTR
ncbi:MAG: DNA cytosine methyltransferase [Desulfovibrio sp.]|jgi:DNA (cytosine-5)-methyltransferase 1|nr:DNA cytosine methyltransferase [Desulfovibrio sp.]